MQAESQVSKRRAGPKETAIAPPPDQTMKNSIEKRRTERWLTTLSFMKVLVEDQKTAGCAEKMRNVISSLTWRWSSGAGMSLEYCRNWAT